MKFHKFVTIITLLLFSVTSKAEEIEKCIIDDNVREEILNKISAGDKDILSKLNDCYSLDRNLIIQASLIDYNQFKNAHPLLKKDKVFVYRLLKVSPKILQFVSPKLLANQNFMEQTTYIYRDALQYANPKILNNRFFMNKMINIDSRNYLFASNRLKADRELARIAFEDNGLLIASAPDSIRADKNLVKVAILSNTSAFDAATPNLKEDKELKKLATKKPHESLDKNLKQFLEDNYLVKENKKNIGFNIKNRAKFSKDNAIVDREYVTKWEINSIIHNSKKEENLKLTPANSHNYPNLWRDDFKKYPTLIKKIETFFTKHNIDKNTIDDLSTTFLWKVKNQPLTLVFNLYLMRDSSLPELGDKFSNLTSLTAIVQATKNDWKMTVIEVIFDSEIPVDISYRDGHKRYIFWDLYQTKQNPKIIFRVEEKFSDSFEIFEEETGGKYQFVSKIDMSLEKQ